MWWDKNDQLIIFKALNVLSMLKFDFFFFFFFQKNCDIRENFWKIYFEGVNFETLYPENGKDT